MTEFCQTLFTMTAAATAAALAVTLLRLLLKKAPRSILCALWLVVLFRMVCPVTFQAPVSLVPAPITSGQVTQQVLPAPAVTNTPPVTAETTPAPTQPESSVQAQTQDPYELLFLVWAAGAGAMALWAVGSYFRLRRRVADAILIQDNIYETDRVDTPFVCGFVKPQIYLPVGLAPAHVPHVVRHEQAHIRRLDHLTKPLFWLALCLHWFNPVLWLAYILFCRDLETACDQRVIRDLDRQATADYAAALLCLGRDRSLPQAVPLAFGEENAKGRVKGVLNYRKPAFWVVILAVILCIGAGFLLLSDGKQGDTLEGVPITQASYDYILQLARAGESTTHGLPITVSLPEDLRTRLVAMLEKYGHEEYTLPVILQVHEQEMETPPERIPLAGDVFGLDLTSSKQETQFYFGLLDNGDGYLERFVFAAVDETSGTRTQQQAAYIPGLAAKRDFQAWQADLETYITEQEASGYFFDAWEEPLPFEGVEITSGELSERIWSWTMLDGSSTGASYPHYCPVNLLEDLLVILETHPHDPEQDITMAGFTPALIAGKLDEIDFYNQDWSHMFALLLSSDGRYLLTHMDEKAGTWKMTYYPDLAASPDFQNWLAQLDSYLSTVIPDLLYNCRVNSVEQAESILDALFLDGIVDSYTIETSPNTITIQAETVYTQDEIEAQKNHYLLWASARIIDLVEDAYHVVWEYPGPEGCTWEYNGTHKAQTIESFRAAYNSPKTMFQ